MKGTWPLLVLAGCWFALPAPAQEPSQAQTPAASTTPVAPTLLSDREKWILYQAAGTPGKAHETLARQAGIYDTSSKTWLAPGAPPLEGKGRAERRALLGKRVMSETYKGDVAGRPFEGSGTVGFDNVSGRYWSIWIDTMSTGLMSGAGTCDEGGACGFEMTLNDPLSGGPKQVRVATRWTSPTQQIFELFDHTADGQEWKALEIVYRKAK